MHDHGNTANMHVTFKNVIERQCIIYLTQYNKDTDPPSKKTKTKETEQ